MPKRLIQDIISTRKIISSPAKSSSPQEKEKKAAPAKIDTGPKDKKEQKKLVKVPFNFPKIKLPRISFRASKPKTKWILAGIAFGVIIIGGILILNRFSSITVEITPRQEFVNVDAVLTASIEPQKNELPLEVMQISRKETGTIQPSGTKQISRKASGQIIIYNVYSSQPQTLIAGTRFQTPEEKIYRIDKTIIAPGAKIDNGKITASEIEAVVYADKPGEEYNGDLTDFTIPGFQDPVKREKIYARSKTKMAGGFIGEAPVATENDINNLESSLKGKVSEYLLQMGVNPKPDNFLFYDGAKKIAFDEAKNKPKPGDQVDRLELSESAAFFGYLLKKSDISQALAGRHFSPDVIPDIEIINPEDLSFELQKSSSNSITFRLSGQAHFAWKIDENSIKKDLIGNGKNSDQLFQKYPAIEKAKIIFKPGWWRRIPQNSSKIAISLIYEQTP